MGPMYHSLSAVIGQAACPASGPGTAIPGLFLLSQKHIGRVVTLWSVVSSQGSNKEIIQDYRSSSCKPER